MAGIKQDEVIRLIGMRIRSIRNKKKLTQEQLAEIAGITPQYLGNIERGKENPTLEKIIVLSNALNVDIGEIFYLLEIEDPKKAKKVIQEKLKNADDEDLKMISRIITSVL